MLQLLSVSIIAHLCAVKYTTFVGSRFVDPQKTAFDFGHYILPRTPYHLPDYILFFIFPVMVVSLISQDKCIDYFHRFLVGFIFRSVCVSITVFPTCVPFPYNNSNNLFLTKHDLIFSGHAFIFISMFFVFSCVWIHCVLILGIISTISSRQHYSIDTLIAIFIGSTFFKTL